MEPAHQLSRVSKRNHKESARQLSSESRTLGLETHIKATLWGPAEHSPRILSLELTRHLCQENAWRWEACIPEHCREQRQCLQESEMLPLPLV